MRFLLIDGQGRSAFVSSKKISFLTSPLTPPLGLLYVGRTLEDKGHVVDVFQFFAEEKIKKSLTSVDSVGISVSTSSYKDVAHIVKIIKESDPSMPVIIGGPHCTFHSKKILDTYNYG